MPDKAAFLTFIVAALALNLAPGPDMLYVIGRSLGQGRRAGVVSALGIFCGCLVHIIAAAVGVAALLRSSPLAFNVVRYAGAVYLVYLGARMLLARPSALNQGGLLHPEPLDKIFYQGVITNVLNPKVAMFFLAFLPQFVNPKGVVVFEIAALGLIFNTGGTLVNLGVALAAGRMGDRLRRSSRAANLQRWFAGTVFVGLGARLALARN